MIFIGTNSMAPEMDLPPSKSLRPVPYKKQVYQQLFLIMNSDFGVF